MKDKRKPPSPISTVTLKSTKSNPCRKPRRLSSTNSLRLTASEDIGAGRRHKIWLNANSRLIYPTRFTGESREVFVEGEIYLEVSPDKSRPFIVRTDRMNVEVLGTSFAVSAYKQESHSRVILASGAVNVYSEEHKRKNKLWFPTRCMNSRQAERQKSPMYPMWRNILHGSTAFTSSKANRSLPSFT